MYGQRAVFAFIMHQIEHSQRMKEITEGQKKLSIKGYGKDPAPSMLTEKEKQILEDIEEQRKSGRLPLSEKICPECNRNMSLITVKSIELDYCCFCDGCWFDPGELRMITELPSDIPSDDLKNRPSRYRCAVCRKPMKEHVFLRPHNLLVDRCVFHGVYLESGELKRSLEINGTRPPIY